MIYLDNNASTPLIPEVISAIEKELHLFSANPSSTHAFGREIKSRILTARHAIANFFSVRPEELIFTSSGTEALNLAIQGFCKKNSPGHIITSNGEHPAVQKTVEQLGWDTTFLPIDTYGAVTPSQVQEAIRPNTRLIILSAVNGETGVKTDIETIATLNIPFIVDGVALLGKELFTIPEGVSAIAFSGHKIHAPKGIGLLVARKSFPFSPLIHGGTQEYERRGGTENTIGIIAFAAAISALKKTLPEATTHMQTLRDHFEANLPHAIVNGEGPRICNTSNLYFPGIEGEILLMQLDLQGIAASHGSACTANSLEPSRILQNMGLGKERVLSSLRFSLSRLSTLNDINHTLAALQSIACTK